MEQANGETGESIMKKRKNDSDMPTGKLTQVRDILPPPSQLVRPEETIKITISLNRSSIEFFKKAAEKNHTKYQRMIRQVLDHYASLYHKAA